METKLTTKELKQLAKNSGVELKSKNRDGMQQELLDNLSISSVKIQKVVLHPCSNFLAGTYVDEDGNLYNENIEHLVLVKEQTLIEILRSLETLKNSMDIMSNRIQNLASPTQK